MQVRCWGGRGSVPVSGDEYRRFGGDTTCIEVRGHDGQVVIIDAGTGIRRLGLHLQSERQAGINLLFTHAHWDHLMGFPFIQPLYESGRAIRIFGCSCAQDSVREMVSESMEPPHFPVSAGVICDNQMADPSLGPLSIRIKAPCLLLGRADLHPRD